MTRVELAALFVRERATFARVYPHVATVPLWVVDRACPEGTTCAARDLAWWDSDGIHIVARALRLPRANLAAICAHELGHAVDVDVWKAGSEQRADDIVEQVLRRRVNYDANDVQTFGKGTYPRPSSLHR